MHHIYIHILIKKKRNMYLTYLRLLKDNTKMPNKQNNSIIFATKNFVNSRWHKNKNSCHRHTLRLYKPRPSYLKLLTNMNLGCDVTWLIKRSYFKYYDILEWESMFTLELIAAKNTHYIKKSFKKVFRNWILYKKFKSGYVDLSHKWN